MYRARALIFFMLFSLLMNFGQVTNTEARENHKKWGDTKPCNIRYSENPCKIKKRLHRQCKRLSIGVFIDSPVSGLTYEADSVSGVTDQSGRFKYKKNESITFSIGGLTLGTANPSAIVTPLDLFQDTDNAQDPRVNNMLVFLQTLDKNGDLNDGIQITRDIAQIVTEYTDFIIFDQPVSTFASDTDVIGLLSELNTAGVFTDTDPRDRTLRKSTAALEHFQRATSDRKLIYTRKGFVKGFEANDSTWQFLGIPYAKPPVGNLRWRPPQKLKRWKGVRDAIAWSDQAAQNPALQRWSEGGMSEDSLYLNVTMPKNARKLPVMVWFHGGYFTALSSNTKAFNNPGGLTKKDVVLVTVNHRLGPFGYMAHPLLSDESGKGSGNYGQMDLIAALKWVQKNIKKFGGDPRNVTIFGESGGGRKVLSLMASPMAKGLFHKAISQSGTLIPDTRTLEQAEEYGTSVSEALGVSTIEEMRAAPWTEIYTASAAATASTDMDPYTNIDDIYLPYSEKMSFENGWDNDVPFMITVNANDTVEPIGTIKDVLPWMSDYKSENIYAGLFNHVPSGWKARGVQAYHACELLYVFNYPASAVLHYYFGLVIDPATGKTIIVGDLNGNGIPGDSTDIYLSAGFNSVDSEVTDSMLTIWTNFAKTGNPSLADIVWPAYTSDNDIYMELNESSEEKTGLSSVFQ